MGSNNKKHLISAEDFVNAVMTYRNITQVAVHLDVGEANVRNRLGKYRKLGVKLPVLERKNGRQVNVSHLNNIIRSYK
jgi:transposase